MRKIPQVLLSSTSYGYLTPARLVEAIHKEFRFDAAYGVETAWRPRVRRLVDPLDAASWGGSTFLNPESYGRALPAWIDRAYSESRRDGGSLVVLLLPARTETRWFWEYAPRGETRLLAGRVTFVGETSSAPFPSCLLIFDGRPTAGPPGRIVLQRY